jgi:hypothetical protein
MADHRLADRAEQHSAEATPATRTNDRHLGVPGRDRQRIAGTAEGVEVGQHDDPGTLLLRPDHRQLDFLLNAAGSNSRARHIGPMS